MEYRIFLYAIPIEIAYFAWYIVLCRAKRMTHHLAYLMAIACVSVLSVEWIRVFLIQCEVFDAQRRDLLWWALEHLPFGGYWYARISEVMRKITHTSPTSTGRPNRSVSDAA